MQKYSKTLIEKEIFLINKFQRKAIYMSVIRIFLSTIAKIVLSLQTEKDL
jgi:hypothetical protein